MRQTSQKAAREEPQERRAQVLDETIRIIGQRGYHGFTIQELAKRCGLSNAGLLYYFGSKDLLLVAVLEEIERRETIAIAPITDRATRRTASSRAVVLELFRTIVAIGTADPEILRLTVILRAEAVEPDHPAHTTFKARDAAALSLFARVLRPYVSDPAHMARRVSAMLDGLGQHWIRAGRSFDIVAEWTRIAEDLIPELKVGKKRRTPRASK